MDKPIQVTRSMMPDFNEYMEEIRDLWETRWLTNMGEKHGRLERALSDFLEASDVTLFANGHLALESAIAALDLKGEVITTPFTFVSTTHAIVRKGLTPVFGDINRWDYTLDVKGLEKLITERTSAIMPVHVFGNICDLDGIQELADKYQLKVIYDAAHAFGVKVGGKSIASYGDLSMFSFHATKVFHTIEGGALAYSDRALRSRIEKLRDFGFSGKESVDLIAGNAKMNEFQAAMGLCNLRHLNDEISKRKRVSQCYRHHLEEVEGISLSPVQPGVESNYAYFPVLFEGGIKVRDEIHAKLKSEGIHPRKYFYPLTSAFECYAGRFDTQSTPVAQAVSDKILTLPLYADLELETVDRICDIIKGGIRRS